MRIRIINATEFPEMNGKTFKVIEQVESGVLVNHEENVWLVPTKNYEDISLKLVVDNAPVKKRDYYDRKREGMTNNHLKLVA